MGFRTMKLPFTRLKHIGTALEPAAGGAFWARGGCLATRHHCAISLNIKGRTGNLQLSSADAATPNSARTYAKKKTRDLLRLQRSVSVLPRSAPPTTTGPRPSRSPRRRSA